MKKTSLVVLISGNGSNLQAIIDACCSASLPAEILAVVSNKKDAYGLERARKAGIATVVLAKRKEQSREDYDAELVQAVIPYQPDLVILAGWMRILSMAFIEHFPNRIINLHPSLPGEFAGMNAIERALQAYRAGIVEDTGVMVHLVPDEGVDLGPVLGQRRVAIKPDDTLATLEERVHNCEHELLVECIHQYILQLEESHA